ncbi:hypothetical protein D9758_013411 [Tetrapyrgos nigripes]|uniref:Queuosine 5'-phosphate N-glycosylase/hydrolase n=1 Tax=Tetrapyrgos nigripes TaxID=182062 RepID=A0A8H5FNU7_9AGAR|nr:hypothetical protein D9758_013411 [Tetrapyrgos nigripes]
MLDVQTQGLSRTPSPWNEKDNLFEEEILGKNPVVEGTEFVYKRSKIVELNPKGISIAAQHIYTKLHTESYTPRTWRTHPLHILPEDSYSPSEPWNKAVLNWIFLISSLNFSFWSEKEGTSERYGVEWQTSWDSKETKVWTGYWSLVAALDRALQENIPITDPNFYSSEILCPDSLIEYIFRAAGQSTETIPLLRERIAIMREVGFILCHSYGGSFQGFLDEFHRRHAGEGTALDLVKMVTETFPSFRDEFFFEGRKVCIWKRAQILVAETWAAFYPDPSTSTTAGALKHPLFPGKRGPAIHELTMFADYRVPQILHHLQILTYPASLVQTLGAGTLLESGSREELSLRAASVVAVERVREEMFRLMVHEQEKGPGDTAGDGQSGNEVSSVLIDFFLWDLAKRVENGEEKIEGIETSEIIPAHRTRSIWY